MRYIVLLLLIGFAASCKKFPEGPAITFRSKKNRVEGAKEIESYTVDGADSLSYLMDSVFQTCANEFFFHKKHTSDTSAGDALVEMPNCSEYDNWLPGWTFTGKNIMYLKFSLVPKDTAVRSDTIVFAHTWDVQRLSKKEMWLQRTQNKKLYEMRFRRTD